HAVRERRATRGRRIMSHDSSSGVGPIAGFNLRPGSAPSQQRLEPLMRETASQTAGPYVHIGLAPKAAGFDIFENNFSNVLVGPDTRGERIRIEGIVYD